MSRLDELCGKGCLPDLSQLIFCQQHLQRFAGDLVVHPEFALEVLEHLMLLGRHHPVGEDDVEAVIEQRQPGLFPYGADGCVYERCRAAGLFVIPSGAFDERPRIVSFKNIAAFDRRVKGSVLFLSVEFVGAQAGHEYRRAGFGFVGDVQVQVGGSGRGAKEIEGITHGRVFYRLNGQG